MRKIFFSANVFCLLILAACNASAIFPTPTIISSPRSLITSIPAPSATPSDIPTHSLERLKDKLPSATLAYGFVVLEMPQTVSWDDMITVTILTVPGTDCLIQYFGTSGLSHAKGLEPQIADSNGICAWTWKQAELLGKNEDVLPLKAKVSIVADGTWGDYYITVK